MNDDPEVEEGVIMVNRRLIAACWVVRLALAASFLSAVADRLGVWGPPGAAGVAWGSVPRYQEYVAQLNWFLPAGLVPMVGWAATACEVMLAIGLLIGWRLHWVAFVAGILLTAFAVMMAVALGPKPPLDYSVPSAAGAAFLLAALTCTTSPRTGPEFAVPAQCGLISGSVMYIPEPLEPAAAGNLLRPHTPVQRPVPDRLGDILRLDVVVPFEIGDRPRHP